MRLPFFGWVNLVTDADLCIRVGLNVRCVSRDRRLGRAAASAPCTGAWASANGSRPDTSSGVLSVVVATRTPACPVHKPAVAAPVSSLLDAALLSVGVKPQLESDIPCSTPAHAASAAGVLPQSTGCLRMAMHRHTTSSSQPVAGDAPAGDSSSSESNSTVLHSVDEKQGSPEPCDTDWPVERPVSGVRVLLPDDSCRRQVKRVYRTTSRNTRV